MTERVGIALLAGAWMIGGAGMAAAEVARAEPGRDPIAGPAAGGMPLVSGAGPFLLQCWQNGVKIIEESDLDSLSLGIDELSGGYSFRRVGDGPRAMYLSSSRDTTCLIKRQWP